MTTPFCRVRPCPGYEVIVGQRRALTDIPAGFAQVVRCRKCAAGKRFESDLDAANAAGTEAREIDGLGARIAVARIEPTTEAQRAQSGGQKS